MIEDLLIFLFKKFWKEWPYMLLIAHGYWVSVVIYLYFYKTKRKFPYRNKQQLKRSIIKCLLVGFFVPIIAIDIEPNLDIYVVLGKISKTFLKKWYDMIGVAVFYWIIESMYLEYKNIPYSDEQIRWSVIMGVFYGVFIPILAALNGY